LRGLRKTTSRFAIAVAAALCIGVTALAPAHAAELWGDCCADLEERVAELEATTVRKSNRNVSVELSGHVNRMLLYWDDGINDDVYSVDNGQSESRFRLSGGASIRPGLLAGFLIEVGTFSADSESVDQRIDGFDTENEDGFLKVRKASFNLRHDQLGKLTVGRDSTATDQIILLNLAQNPIADASVQWAERFFLVARPNTGINSAALGCRGASCRTSLRRRDLAPDLDTRRGDILRYDTPALFGLVISAAWGEDDLADVAIRYRKEWNSIRLVAGIGYLWETDETEDGATKIIRCPPPGLGQAACVDERRDFEDFKGSASMMHLPTGLYVYGAFARQDPGRSISSPLRASTFTAPVTDQDAQDATMWYIQAGVKRRLLAPSLGATTLYGEYQKFDDFGVRRDAAPITGLEPGISEITDTSTQIWGLGLVQDIDVAAMKLYAAYRQYDFNARVATASTAPAGQNVPFEDFHAVALGGRIDF